MTRLKRRRFRSPLVALVAGAILFAAGLTILRLNPYWRPAGWSQGQLHDHVYAWEGVGHLVSALGMLCLFAGVAVGFVVLLARLVRINWVYWVALALVACILAGWVAITGLSKEYEASFHWEASAGVTKFKVVIPQQEWDNFLWQTLVRWQIEPDLNGYLRASGMLESTDGDVEVTVVRIVPIALPAGLGSGGQSLQNTQWKRP